MFRTSIALCLSVAMLAGPLCVAQLPGEGNDEGRTVIYRDEWGIPHIYAPNDEAGLYAQGYAMAEDRPEQLLINILAAIGELSMIAGPDTVQSDLRSHMFDHYGVAKRNWNQISRPLQRHIMAFADGMNAFYAEHPEDKPVWWQGRTIDPYMLVAFGRLFLYNWSIDEAYEDLERGGIEPGYEADQRGSNQFAVSPQRTKNGHAILAIDPHLAWFGPSRFWEFRIHAGELHGSGVTLPGSPYVGLGHNADLAWAMTTGGPDTADIYELTLHEGDPTKYLYDGVWRSLTTRDVTLQVRGVGEQTHTLQFSHHGPIVAIQDGRAYAAAMAYADVVNITDAWHNLNYARDYTGAVRAMQTLTVFPQNVMVADTSGNIFYERTGRVPVRAEGFDWSRPVNGSTWATEWRGFHSSADHLHVLNPPQGYMQNCNIPPDAMIPNSPFRLADHRDYLYSGPGYGKARAGWTNQRGARAIELLSANDEVTPEDAIAIINDVHPYGVERWIEALRSAHAAYGDSQSNNADYAIGIQDILDWDQQLTKGSSGALKYLYWREQMVLDNGEEAMAEGAALVDDWYAIVEGRAPKPVDVPDEGKKLGVESFARALARIKENHGSIWAVYGERFRVGRDEQSWPVGGGGRYGTTTLRAMSYDAVRDDHTQWGRAGQTSTQVVEMSKPIKSWIYIPIGESDRPDSRHYTDQARFLFSEREMKPSRWMPEDLQGHWVTRTVLENAPE